MSGMLLWLQTVMGLWVLLSPWILGFGDISLAKWSSILSGLIIFLVGVWNIYFQNQKHS